jgi:hypothetical protein
MTEFMAWLALIIATYAAFRQSIPGPTGPRGRVGDPGPPGAAGTDPAGNEGKL